MISIRHAFASKKDRATFADPMLFVDDVYRYALARTNRQEDAEDIAIEVVQQSPKHLKPDELKPYMIGMARRKVADHFRHANRSIERPNIPSETQIEAVLDVQRALETMSESHRECLILKYVTGLSSAEIGTQISLSSEAVDSLLQRARKAFAKEWEIMHGEDNAR